VGVAGGELRIVGRFDSTYGKDISGGVSARFNQLYGRWEIRFRVDRGGGYSAAVLLWPRSERWPTDGEIDLAEVNRRHRQTGLNYVHNNPANNSVGHTMRADFTRWHTIAVDWLPDRVTFYLDGAAQFTVSRPRTPGAINLVPDTSPMHLALQLDQGCGGFIDCRDAQTPREVVMHVDWVRTFSLPTQPVGPFTGRTPLSSRRSGSAT
jgi:hypothetical protein